MSIHTPEMNISSGDHREILDLIDSLRSQGVSRYVDLPEIIVCGDQSAGKSSVLEAISGMDFPVRDGLCTRFATELVLRRGVDVSVKVSITPGEERWADDKERLERWQPTSRIEEVGLAAVTEEAKSAMALGPTGTAEFYRDSLRIVLTGPTQPHLTLVDLPGLFRVGNKEQSDANVDLVRSMVKEKMARERSIILTVVSAQYSYVLQEVTRMARQADPEGLRTIGLITKPDTLETGTKSESYFVRLAQNHEEELRLGWHVLRNRKHEERDGTLTERNNTEIKFFSSGIWASISRSHCGVSALKDRLSTILKEQILTQLPSLEKDVEAGINNCSTALQRLGPVRDTVDQQRSYMHQVSDEYTSLMTQAVEGVYTDRFFGHRGNIEMFHRRLRAVLRSISRVFAEDMRSSGQAVHIIDSDSESEEVEAENIRDSPQISRSEYVDNVANHLKYSRGRELPGLFNPLVVTDLFIDQSRPWEEITNNFAENILEAVHETTESIIKKITANDVTEEVLNLIRQKLDGLRHEMSNRIGELLRSAEGHAMTLNPQLTENVQRSQSARQNRLIKQLFLKTFGVDRLSNSDNTVSVNPIEMMGRLKDIIEPDMERYGSSVAVDYMQAYYKVAVNRFIDDVGELAIEDCLMSKLSTLFTSKDVLSMNDDDISRLAGETDDSAMERQQLNDKRRILETGIQGLRRLRKRNRLPKAATKIRSTPDGGDRGTLTIIPRKPSIATTVSSTPPSVNREGFNVVDEMGSELQEAPPAADIQDPVSPSHPFQEPVTFEDVDDFWSAQSQSKKDKKKKKAALLKSPEWAD